MNPLLPGVPFLYPLKISENRKFPDILRGYKKGTSRSNGLINASKVSGIIHLRKNIWFWVFIVVFGLGTKGLIRQTSKCLFCWLDTNSTGRHLANNFARLFSTTGIIMPFLLTWYTAITILQLHPHSLKLGDFSHIPIVLLDWWYGLALTENPVIAVFLQKVLDLPLVSLQLKQKTLKN